MTQASQSAQTSPTHTPTSPTNYRLHYRTPRSDDPLDLIAQVEPLRRFLNQPLELLVGESKWHGVNLTLPRLRNYFAHSQSYWDPSVGSVVFTTRFEEANLIDPAANGVMYQLSLETLPELSGIHLHWGQGSASLDWLEPFFNGLSTSARGLGAPHLSLAKAEAPTVTSAPDEEITARSNNGKNGPLFDPIYTGALLAIQKGIVERGAPRHFIGSFEDLMRDEDLEEPLSEVAGDFAEEPYRPEFGRGPFHPHKR